MKEIFEKGYGDNPPIRARQLANFILYASIGINDQTYQQGRLEYERHENSMVDDVVSFKIEGAH